MSGYTTAQVLKPQRESAANRVATPLCRGDLSLVVRLGQVVLVVSALLADAVALWAIAARITEFGFSPNRVAALRARRSASCPRTK